MREKGARLQQLLLAAALVAAVVWNLAHASELKSVRVEAGATGTRAELRLDARSAYNVISLANPDRLVVDLPESSMRRNLAMPAAAGVVQSVRSGQPQPGTVRIVFDLAQSVRALPPRLESDAGGGARLVLEWPGDAAAQPLASQPAPTPQPQQQPARDPIAEIARRATSVSEPAPVVDVPSGAAPLPAEKPMPGTIATGVPTRIATGVPTPVAQPQPAAPAPQPAPAPRVLPQNTRPLVVAIDPGHGGQDPGAVGLNGTREKDITLAIARELARQVNATPGLKAVLTRDADYFIPLGERARKASRAGADIFLSIHADAAENRSARGSSIYILSTRGASSQRARWLADKENAADIIGGDRVRVADNTLTSVLLDLTQSGNLRASEDAASHVLGGLKRVGNNHKPNIERANFAVLRTSDKFPAMLVETAFISNPDEERRLNDPAFQRKLATAILDGVDTYFTRQPPPGTLYAARARDAAGSLANTSNGAP